MRILHTSDWHLGHQHYNYDRQDEHQYFLDQLAAHVREQRPDVLIVAGDVHHTPTPSIAAQRQFSRNLLELANANPDMQIVIIAGNHDSGARHEINDTLWQTHRVHLVGQLHNAGDEENPHIIRVPGKGNIVAIPYTPRVEYAQEMAREYVGQIIEDNPDNLPVILTTHATIRGCDPTGHPDATEKIVGGIEASDIKGWGDADYVALGHIHHPQDIATTSAAIARYSGSPIPINFDEAYSHSVTIVDIDRHNEAPRLEMLPITPLREMTSLGEYGDWKEALDTFKKFDAESTDYVRLNVRFSKDMPSDLDARARVIAEDKNCRYCLINVRREEQKKSSGPSEMTVNEIHEITPQSLIEDYLRSCSVDFTGNLKNIFEEVMAEVNKDQREQ